MILSPELLHLMRESSAQEVISTTEPLELSPKQTADTAAIH